MMPDSTEIRKLRVAIVSTNRNKYSETFIHNHIRLLPATIHFLFDGYLPQQYSTDGGNTSYEFDIKVKQSRISLFKSKNNKKSLQQNAISRYLKKNAIDLVLCEYGPSGVEMMELTAQLKIPLVVHFHGYDAYRMDILESYGKQYPALFQAAKAIIAVSRHMREQLIRLGCPAEKMHMLIYGIDTNIFKESREKRELTFVACGRFVAKKAPLQTISAFAKVVSVLPSVRLVMIGDGELLEESIRLASSLGVKGYIDFKGGLSQLEIATIYSTALAFVQHSVTTPELDSEGTPLALLESAACGLPAVTTRHAGISDVVVEGKTGFLVDENDVDSMAGKMIVLAKHPQLAAELGTNAAKRVQEGYTIEGYTSGLMKLIEKCCESDPA